MLKRASCPANTSLHCLTQSRGKKMCYSADKSIKWYLAEHSNNCECSSVLSTMLSTQGLDILDLSASLLSHNHWMKGWCPPSHSWGETAPWWVSQFFCMAEKSSPDPIFVLFGSHLGLPKHSWLLYLVTRFNWCKSQKRHCFSLSPVENLACHYLGTHLIVCLGLNAAEWRKIRFLYFSN